MIFFPENGDRNVYSASLSLSYVKEKHDLYKWTYPQWPDSEPVFGGLEKPGQFGGFIPNGYNENCYINDGPYVPDLSGKSVRPRQFGWPQSDNWYHHFGIRESIGIPHRLWPSPTEPITDELLIEKIQNIGYWNSGFATSVLISPRHFITTKHAFIPGIPQLSVNFILKDGTVINRIGSRVTRPDGSELAFGDILVFRLSEQDSLEQYVNTGLIKVYDDYIAVEEQETFDYFLTENDPFTINRNRIVGWMVEGQERVLRGSIYSLYLPEYFTGVLQLNGFEISPDLLFRYLKNNDKKIDDYQVSTVKIFVGDSGSPLFCYDKNSGKTILMGLCYLLGSRLGYVLNEYNNLFFVEQELQNNGGYSLNKLNINDLDLVRTEDFPLIDLNPPEQPPTPIILPSKPYSNSFKNINTSPLNKYPYSSRIYSNGQ